MPSLRIAKGLGESAARTGDVEHSVRAREKLDERDDGGALGDQQADHSFDRVGLGFGDLQHNRGDLQFQLASRFL